MIKTTQKNLLWVYKNKRFEVLFFNPDGTRILHYGRCDILSAFTEIVKRASRGERVIVFESGKLKEAYAEVYGNMFSGTNLSMKDKEAYTKLLPYSMDKITKHYNPSVDAVIEKKEILIIVDLVSMHYRVETEEGSKALPRFKEGSLSEFAIKNYLQGSYMHEGEVQVIFEH